MRGPRADPFGLAARAEPDFEPGAVGCRVGSSGDGILTRRSTGVPAFAQPQLAYGRADGWLGGGGAGGVDDGGGRHHHRTQQDNRGCCTHRPLVDQSGCRKQHSVCAADALWGGRAVESSSIVGGRRWGCSVTERHWLPAPAPGCVRQRPCARSSSSVWCAALHRALSTRCVRWPCMGVLGLGLHDQCRRELMSLCRVRPTPSTPTPPRPPSCPAAPRADPRPATASWRPSGAGEGVVYGSLPGSGGSSSRSTARASRCGPSSHGLRRLAVLEAVRGSYDQAKEAIDRRCGKVDREDRGDAGEAEAAGAAGVAGRGPAWTGEREVWSRLRIARETVAEVIAGPSTPSPPPSIRPRPARASDPTHGVGEPARPHRGPLPAAAPVPARVAPACMSKKDIFRCLKRFIAREVYKHLTSMNIPQPRLCPATCTASR